MITTLRTTGNICRGFNTAYGQDAHIRNTDYRQVVLAIRGDV